MYIKIETSKLDFHRIKQFKIQSELYQGIVDSVIVGEAGGSQMGKMIVLPTTFIGGPRDMRHRYYDAMI